MSQLRGEILKLLSSELPLSLSNWNTLLNFFDHHKDSLDFFELEMLADRSEVYREYWNASVKEEQTINKDGKDIKIQTVRSGLGIEQSAVSPNIIAYIDEIRSK